MFIRLHTVPDGSKVWYVSTDDHQYDAADVDQLAAVMRVAEHMEEDLREKKAPADLTTDEAVAALRRKLTGGPSPESYHFCDYKGCSGHLGIHGYCFTRPSAENGS